MNQLLLQLRATSTEIRAKAAPYGAGKIEELRNSLTEFLDAPDTQKSDEYEYMVKRAKKALGIKY